VLFVQLWQVRSWSAEKARPGVHAVTALPPPHDANRTQPPPERPALGGVMAGIGLADCDPITSPFNVTSVTVRPAAFNNLNVSSAISPLGGRHE
jgi:hypothetical protein